MESVVILGAGQMGRAAGNLLNQNHIRLIAIGDNDPQKRQPNAKIPILSVEEALLLKPDRVLICVLDDERAGQLLQQLQGCGYQGRVMLLNDVYTLFDVRGATLRRLAERMDALSVPGSIAELGTYKGDFAWQLNTRFPEKKLYLFDTFEGFDGRDITAERTQSNAKVNIGDFGDTSIHDVLSRMPHSEKIIIRRGFFPDTAKGLENEQYALVSLDVDLYAPTLAGLTYFYPRMSSGGAIILHDYNSFRFDGVRRAVADYEKEKGILPLLPLSDLHGTAIIIKP